MADMFSSQSLEDTAPDADPVSDFADFQVLSPSDEEVFIVVLFGCRCSRDYGSCFALLYVLFCFSRIVAVQSVFQERYILVALSAHRQPSIMHLQNAICFVVWLA
jgi:hypothetical protein